MPGYSAALMTTAKILYRAEEAAELMSVSRTAIFGLISSGDLRSVKIGGRRRIPRTSIEDYVARLDGHAEQLADDLNS
jgi:excisionase family DNA binding protein